jgi:hypothetical protein
VPGSEPVSVFRAQRSYFHFAKRHAFARHVFKIAIRKSKRSESHTMTKSRKVLTAAAALAGLLAGTTASVQASNLLPGAFSSAFHAQEQAPDQNSDKQVKDKHACKGHNSCKGNGGCKSSDNGCKGKNSCKGKGGCATDGSKPPQA